MDNILNGIISYKIKIKGFDDSNNKPTKCFIKSLNGHDETILKFIKNVEGADILFPQDPLFCFITDAGDYLLVKDMSDNTLDIFVLWISSISPYNIIKSSSKELYEKLKSNKKNVQLKFVNSKFELLPEQKVVLYPTYKSNNYNKINTENKFDFLKIKREKLELFNNKAFVIRLICAIVILALFVFSIIFKVSDNIAFLLFGAFIPEVINLFISWANKNNENIFIDITTLRIIDNPSEIHETEFDNEKLEQVKDPE
ncbi:hypothetical protein [Mammaliicoccus sciuri]|uniref:hypothetical protein n=1 Tax=Mammaliicoccus sciuri TaxID=1296 RepID=UPI003CF82C39